MSTVSKIKDVCEDILDEMKALINDFANLEGASKDVKAGLEDGTIVDKGLAAGT